MTKKCPTCKIKKDAKKFSVSRRNKDGLCWRCKDCDKKWLEANKKEYYKKQNSRYANSKELKEAAKLRVYKMQKKKYNSTE